MKSNNQPSSISFSNFKCFGEKKQSFSKKPLTLVYGPNSVGKSSVLHLLVLAEYYKNLGPVNFVKNDPDESAEMANFAGDKLDLGGFGNFIHRKDKTRKLVYEEHYYGAKHTDRFLEPFLGPVRVLESEGAFLTAVTFEEVCERLQTYERKDDSCVILSGAKRFFTRPARDFIDPSDLKLHVKHIDKENSGILPELEHEKVAFIIKEIDSGYDLKENLKRGDEKPFDALDKLVIYILDTIDRIFIYLPVGDYLDGLAAETLRHIRAFKRILNIRSIDFIHELGERHEDNKLIIDGVWFIKSTGDTRTAVVNTAHSVFGGNCDDLLHLGVLEPINPSGNLFQYAMLQNASTARLALNATFVLLDPTALARTIVYEYVRSINGKTQYFGPLRYYPLRHDMTATCDSRAVENYGVITAEIDYTASIETFVTAVSARPRIFGLLSSAPKLVRLALFLFSPSMRKILFLSGKGGLRRLSRMFKNKFRNSKRFISFSGSVNSEQVWLQLIHSKDIQCQVNRWLSETSKLGSKYTLVVQESVKHGFFRKLFRRGPKQHRKLTFVDSRTNTEVTPREMGLGISQFLPILIAAKALRDHRILIEQPELHLHPAAQCEVADEFIRSYHEQDNDFVIETHSEHLLLRVMKRMRQTADGTLAQDHPLAITPEDVCLLYVDNNDELTYLNELELDSDGSLLDPWPNGFFEEGYRERFN